jgi:hypothetical protein
MQDKRIITDEERFHFDTQGFLLLRGVLDDQSRRRLLEKLDELEARDFGTEKVFHFSTANPTDGAPRPHPGSSMEQATRATVDDHYLRMNGLPNLDPIFDELIDHPRVLPYLQEFMGEPRLSNTWYIAKSKGPRFSSWHAGLDPSYYRCTNGAIRARMINTAWMLTDNGPDDGCLLAVPGSHKANLTLNLSDYPGLTLPGSVCATGKAGDVLLFTECTLHMGNEKATTGSRRNVYYNFMHESLSRLTDPPATLRHAWFPPSVRNRFNETQKMLTDWMDYVECPAT